MNQRPFITAAAVAAIAVACFCAPLALAPAPVEIFATLDARGPVDGLRGRFLDVSDGSPQEEGS